MRPIAPELGPGTGGRRVSPMLDALGVVVSDMERSVAFYRLLGLEFPEGAASEGHAGVAAPRGLRFMLDTEETVRSFDPDWRRPEGTAIGLAFLCESPADVDRLVRRAGGAGRHCAQGAVGRLRGQRYAQA